MILLFFSDTYPSHAGLSMIQKVQLQTRIEMWGEKGLEFYNNRRWDIFVTRGVTTNHWHDLKQRWISVLQIACFYTPFCRTTLLNKRKFVNNSTIMKIWK